jgi:hypothetical protein
VATIGRIATPANGEKVRATRFCERARSGDPYNASDVVALGDSRFCFCDNNSGDALVEFRLASDGTLAGPLTRRPIEGIAAGSVDDLEAMTLVRREARTFIVAVPSLSLKERRRRHRKKSKRGKEAPTRSGLLRISVAVNGQLHGEILTGFREWIVANAPSLGRSPRYLPDDGGLNLEGLSWDAAGRSLLLGLRSPLIDRKPVILRARLKDIDGPWELSNFEMLPETVLAIGHAEGEQGIRALEYDRERRAWLVVVGNSTSASKAPFSLYSWDGNAEGVVRMFANLRFHKRMKVEGVAHGTIGGRDAIVFVDDAGGYARLWDDDPRFQ